MKWRTALLLIALAPACANAHGGGLDANGCHTNRKTGEYHCHRGGGAAANKSTQPRSAADGQCGSKYYCKEMSSCEEAMHYLNDCGLTRLDGDSDGIPCENLCGSHR